MNLVLSWHEGPKQTSSYVIPAFAGMKTFSHTLWFYFVAFVLILNLHDDHYLIIFYLRFLRIV